MDRSAANGIDSRQVELTTTTAPVASTIAFKTETLRGSRKSIKPRGSWGRVLTLFITPSMSRKMTLRGTDTVYPRSASAVDDAA